MRERLREDEEEDRSRKLPEASGEITPADTWIWALGLQNCETTKACCLSPPGWGTSFRSSHAMTVLEKSSSPHLGCPNVSVFRKYLLE